VHNNNNNNDDFVQLGVLGFLVVFGTSPVVIAPSMKLSSSGFNQPGEEEGSGSFFNSFVFVQIALYVFCAVHHFLRISLVLTFVLCFLCGWFFLSLHGFGGRGQGCTRSTLLVGFVCHYYMASSEV